MSHINTAALNTEIVLNEVNTMSHSFTLAAQKSTTDVPMCSHWEATQGISVDYSVTTGINLYALKMKDSVGYAFVKSRTHTVVEKC